MTAGAALLIGNTNYLASSSFPPLRTPHDDIENLSDDLIVLGFETYVVHDADRMKMLDVLSLFRTVVAGLPTQSSVFIYFAGHGIQRDGENFIVPIDARGVTDASVLGSSIRLSELMAMLCWREDQQKLIAIDACRTNHVPSSTRSGGVGLADQSPDRYERVEETYVLYATASGKLALDGVQYGGSPFCMGLRKAFAMPGVPISTLAAYTTSHVYRLTDRIQKPWGVGNLGQVWPFTAQSGPADAGVSASPVFFDRGTVGESQIAASVPPHVAPEDRYIAERGHLVHKLKAKDTTGRWAYYFVFVEPHIEARFLAAIEGVGTLDIETFGPVIASCYGQEPDDEVRLYLWERYGFVV